MLFFFFFYHLTFVNSMHLLSVCLPWSNDSHNRNRIAIIFSLQWLNHGKDLTNRRFADEEVKISQKTVSQLQLKWKFVAGRDITTTPAIFDGTLYFPSWNGNLYAVDAKSGSLVWRKNLGELTGLNAAGFVANVNVTVSWSTPTVVGRLLIVGIYGPAVVIAVDRATGDLVWLTRLDPHDAAIITMSGTVSGRSEHSFNHCSKKSCTRCISLVQGKIFTYEQSKPMPWPDLEFWKPAVFLYKCSPTDQFFCFYFLILQP